MPEAIIVLTQTKFYFLSGPKKIELLTKLKDSGDYSSPVEMVLMPRDKKDNSGHYSEIVANIKTSHKGVREPQKKKKCPKGAQTGLKQSLIHVYAETNWCDWRWIWWCSHGYLESSCGWIRNSQHLHSSFETFGRERRTRSRTSLAVYSLLAYPIMNLSSSRVTRNVLLPLVRFARQWWRQPWPELKPSSMRTRKRPKRLFPLI